MAWERRRNGRLYYYRCWRDPTTGRVRKQYVGTGPAAEAAAKDDGDRRAARAAKQQAMKDQRQLDMALSEQVMQVIKEAEALTEAALLVAGFHRPQRKPWRKRRSWRTEDDDIK